jgi:hypothetical protein
MENGMTEVVAVAPDQPGEPDVLSAAEAELVRAAVAGEHADLKRHAIRAVVLRDLLLEARPGWVLPPLGLRLSKAIIQGCLDLEGATLSKPFLVWHSRFEAGGDKGAIVIRDGRLRRLGIHSCTVLGNIVADRAEFDNGLFLGGGLVKGTLLVRGANVGGALALEGTEIGDGKAAMLGAGARITGPLILRRAKASGEIALPRAHLHSGVYAEGLVLEQAGTAFNAESARLGGDMLLAGAQFSGAISLVNARIEGRLSGEGFVVEGNPTAIDARGLEVSHGIVLDNARLRGSLLLEGAKVGNTFHAEGLEIDGGETAIGADVIQVGGNWEMPRAKLIGLLAIPGARIEGQLRLTEARLFGTDIAIRGDGARIHGGCFLSRATVHGLVRFPAAEFGNQLRLRGATLKVDAGAALLASGAMFKRDIELTGGAQLHGAVVLDQARIHGALDLRGSQIVSAAIARGGNPVPPASAHAAVHGDETAVSLVDAQINRLVMPLHAADRPRGIVDLSRARAGSFEDHAEAWTPPPSKRAMSKDGREIDHMVLDGFVYDHLTNPSGISEGSGKPKSADRVSARRIVWLDGQMEADGARHFKPQAWVALADRLSRQGYVDDSRRIEIARLRRERRSAASTFGGRWQNRLLDWFALYGHNPWRTVVWMMAVVVLFAGVWAGAQRMCTEADCFDETVFVIRNKDAYRDERFRQTYPGFHALAYSFDVFVPFVSFGYEDHWRPNIDFGPIAELPLPWPGSAHSPVQGAGGKSPTKEPTVAITIGGLLYVLGIIEAIIGIVLTSLMVTGFTGILKGRAD